MKFLQARMLTKKNACKFYLTVHRFHARVQSSTCTTYSKYLRKNIMTMLTPKSGIQLLDCSKSNINWKMTMM